MKANDIAIIGMGAIGQAIALNIINKKYNLAIYDDDYDIASNFAKDNLYIKPYDDIKLFMSSMAVPRKIFICTDAESIDDMISEMMLFLSKGDTIIDVTESYYRDSKARAKKLKYKMIRYLDVALSGAIDEISTGAGIIAGGQEDTFGACSRILRQISKDYNGYSSCIHSGICGTGHFSKMVHDNIEYSLLQVITESYFCMRSLGNMTCEEISSAFGFMNEDLNSYLLKITAHILEQSDDDTGKPIIDLIMDSAMQDSIAVKGIHEALDLGASNTIAMQAVFSRIVSCQREERRLLSKKLSAPVKKYDNSNIKLIDIIKDAMKASMIIAYTQGFDMLKSALQNDDWKYGEDEISRIWCGSSVIKSYLLDKAHSAYNKNEDILNILQDDYFANALKNAQKGWREVVVLAAKHCIPMPSVMSSLSYYDAIRSNILPANLIQAQRNFLGKDTVKRYDVQGDFNIEWFKRT